MYSTKFPGIRPFVPGTPGETMLRGDLRGQFDSIQLAFDRLFKSNKACSIAGRNLPPAFLVQFCPEIFTVWSSGLVLLKRERERESPSLLWPPPTSSGIGMWKLLLTQSGVRHFASAQWLWNLARSLLLSCCYFVSALLKKSSSTQCWDEVSFPVPEGWHRPLETKSGAWSSRECVCVCGRKGTICSIRKCKIYFTLNPPLTSNRMIERLWNYWSKNECIPLICLSELEWLVGLADYELLNGDGVYLEI